MLRTQPLRDGWVLGNLKSHTWRQLNRIRLSVAVDDGAKMPLLVHDRLHLVCTRKSQNKARQNRAHATNAR
jgi:hypothetical protein